MRPIMLAAVLLVLAPVSGAAAARPVAFVTLPGRTPLMTLEVGSGGLVVSGKAVRGPDCSVVTVDPKTMRRGPRTDAPCGRVALAAHPVAPAAARSAGSSRTRVRILRLDPKTKHVKRGPVVMTFIESSTSHLLWTYGGGSLWLFASTTPTGAQALRVSEATGTVEATVPLPRIFRPLLAANDEGLWLAVSPTGGAPGRGASPIYHIALGARAAVVVHREGRAAVWLTAAGHTVWADLVSGETSQRLWRFDGAGARASRLAAANGLAVDAAVVDPRGRPLWALSDIPKGGSFLSCAGVRVVAIDSRTGRQTPHATVRLPGDPCSAVSAPVLAGGYLYFLDQLAAPQRLYRVRL